MLPRMERSGVGVGAAQLEPEPFAVDTSGGPKLTWLVASRFDAVLLLPEPASGDGGGIRTTHAARSTSDPLCATGGTAMLLSTATEWEGGNTWPLFRAYHTDVQSDDALRGGMGQPSTQLTEPIGGDATGITFRDSNRCMLVDPGVGAAW